MGQLPRKPRKNNVRPKARNAVPKITAGHAIPTPQRMLTEKEIFNFLSAAYLKYPFRYEVLGEIPSKTRDTTTCWLLRRGMEISGIEPESRKVVMLIANKLLRNCPDRNTLKSIENMRIDNPLKLARCVETTVKDNLVNHPAIEGVLQKKLLQDKKSLGEEDLSKIHILSRSWEFFNINFMPRLGIMLRAYAELKKGNIK